VSEICASIVPDSQSSAHSSVLEAFDQAVLHHAESTALPAAVESSPAKVKYWLNTDVKVHGRVNSPSSKKEFAHDSIIRATEALSPKDDVYVRDNDGSLAVAHIVSIDRPAGTFNLHFFQKRSDGLFDLKYGKNIVDNWDLGDFISVAQRLRSGGHRTSRFYSTSVEFVPCKEMITAGGRAVGRDTKPSKRKTSTK
jgi:hypothetical protein